MALSFKQNKNVQSRSAVIAKLKKYHNLMVSVADQYERLVRLRETVSTPRRSELTGMPKGHSPEGYDYKQVELVYLESEYEEAMKSLQAEREAFTALVSQLESGYEAKVIRLRYYDWMEWKDVSFEMFGDHVDYNDKEESYIRRTHKIHESALNKLSDHSA